MTVQELIEQLQGLDPIAEVVFHDCWENTNDSIYNVQAEVDDCTGRPIVQLF